MELICPYPGLRPFNEEESIFFKGRELQVERIVKKLEEKKFLMVNGASGDGKSSLIFAGVIPYAKAGFFKAKYNNWLVADFRPERSPLRNLTASLCKQLKIEDVSGTEKKLGYGFSALCELYKASDYYIDESKSDWLNSDEAQKKALKRKGANLLVLVDQFEEFFTNPENYLNGTPGLESQKTINLLLETYKIAAEQNLPIYVVCTMRSDYIGQCAAFRGLPEAIGYSQFFVPRLKRQEIEQAIEGPAELAGCKISKRLTQTLLNSLNDGFDQLPILQHALRRIWETAASGSEEMDLLHLAKVGGMPQEILSLEDKKKFKSWFDLLPSFKKDLFTNPSLSNVLNAHANELFLSAHLFAKQKFGFEMGADEAQSIIRRVFQGLTRVDASRAVRNRLTLQEITNIIHDKNITTLKVDQLLYAYRQQGNTFIQPFVEEELDYKPLNPDTVLDITHESLIRNWTKCTEWANEEHENVQTYFDFDKQLERWLNSKNNKGYLLPIGPLTYFENWYNNLKPNVYWLNRYEKFEGNSEQKLNAATKKLNQIQSFLAESSKKLFFSKTILKYGAKRLSIAAGLVLLIALCTFFYLDYRKKQNEYVIKELLAQGKEMIHSLNVSNNAKASFLINRDRLNFASGKEKEFDRILNSLNSDTLAFDIAFSMFNQCHQKIDSTNYDKEGNYAFDIFRYLSANFEKEISGKIVLFSKNKIVPFSKFSSNRINNFLTVCAQMKYDGAKGHRQKTDSIINNSIVKTKRYLEEAIKSQTFQKNLVDGHILFTVSTLLAIDDNPDYRSLISLLSPYEKDSEARSRFDTIFKSNQSYNFDCVSLNKQGGYELLSLLYASRYHADPGVKTQMITLIDSCLKNKNYTSLSPANNPTLQSIYLLLYKLSNLNNNNFDFILEKTVQNNLEKGKFLGNSIHKLFAPLNVRENFPSSFIQCFVTSKGAVELFDRGEKFFLNNEFNDSTKMNLAIFYKKRGYYYATFLNSKFNSDLYFQTALNYYRSTTDEHKVAQHYYDETGWGKDQNLTWFLFPGLINEYIFAYDNCQTTTVSKKEFPGNNEISPFFNFISKDHSSNIFKEFKYFHLLSSFDQELSQGNFKMQTMALLSEINQDNPNAKFPQSVKENIVFFRVYELLCRKKLEMACKKIDSLFSHLPNNYEGDYNFILPNAVLLAQNADTLRTKKLISYIQSPEEKNKILLRIIDQLQDGPGIENTFYFLNKLIKSNSETGNIGMGLFRIFGKIGGAKIEKLTPKKFRNTPEFVKPMALDNWVLGTAESGNYFKAKMLIPNNVSETKELRLINQILKAEIIRKEKKNRENAGVGTWNDSEYFLLDIENVVNKNNTNPILE